MLRFLVKGAVVVLLLYAGATFGFPYYQYVMMQWAVEEAADEGVAQVKAMMKGPWREEVILGQVTAAVTPLMQARANRVRLALPAKGVQVSLEPDLFRVRANWEAEAGLGGYAHRFHFHVEGKRIVVR